MRFSSHMDFGLPKIAVCARIGLHPPFQDIFDANKDPGLPGSGLRNFVGGCLRTFILCIGKIHIQGLRDNVAACGYNLAMRAT